VTPREGEVLELIHLRNADIAIALGISRETVKTHLDAIYEKFGVETRTAAALAWVGMKAEAERAAWVAIAGKAA
jgi:DNA-binding CsgD family transcriptional regulator